MYHVQTEDRGPSHPFLDTVVYMAGRVVYKRSTSYERFAHQVDAKALAQKLHERLSQQHREVIAELEAGNLSKQATEKVDPAAENDGGEEALALRLLNPKNWIAAGNVTLEIELSETASQQRIADAELQAFLEYEKRRIPCAKARTDANGHGTIRFPMPPDVAEGSSLVVRATDGMRFGELQFRLKLKPVEKKPAPVS